MLLHAGMTCCRRCAPCHTHVVHFDLDQHTCPSGASPITYSWTLLDLPAHGLAYMHKGDRHMDAHRAGSPSHANPPTQPVQPTLTHAYTHQSDFEASSASERPSSHAGDTASLWRYQLHPHLKTDILHCKITSHKGHAIWSRPWHA